MLKFACVCPHPTAIIPGENDPAITSTFKKTLSAYEKMSEELLKIKPENLVIISPFGPMRYDKFTINLEETLRGTFQTFGIFEHELEMKNNINICREIIKNSRANSLPIELIREPKIDYATLIILNYLLKSFPYKPKIIPLTFTVMDLQTHFFFGKLIGDVLDNSDESFAIIGSGDLSRRLSDSSPAGYSPYGEKLDKTIQEIFKRDLPQEIINLNPEFCQEAEEVGLRSISILLGSILSKKRTYQHLAYEAPLGTGHVSAYWKLK